MVSCTKKALAGIGSLPAISERSKNNASINRLRMKLSVNRLTTHEGEPVPVTAIAVFMVRWFMAVFTYFATNCHSVALARP